MVKLIKIPCYQCNMQGERCEWLNNPCYYLSMNIGKAPQDWNSLETELPGGNERRSISSHKSLVEVQAIVAMLKLKYPYMPEIEIKEDDSNRDI